MVCDRLLQDGNATAAVVLLLLLLLLQLFQEDLDQLAAPNVSVDSRVYREVPRNVFRFVGNRVGLDALIRSSKLLEFLNV
jgi:hypothetical protein